MAHYLDALAVQITSQIADAQQFIINFTNNNLLGSANFSTVYLSAGKRSSSDLALSLRTTLATRQHTGNLGDNI